MAGWSTKLKRATGSASRASWHARGNHPNGRGTATADSTTGGSILEPWQPGIDGKLENGSATVTVTPLGPGTPNFGAATAIRVVISVNWNELGRPKSVRMSSIRF